MAARKRGAANVYDIPLYNERDDIKLSEPSHSSASIRTHIKKDEDPGAYVKLLIYIAAAVVVLWAVVAAKVETASVRSEINEEIKKVEMLKSENTRMQAQIETKTSRKAVESYAEDILGMQKLDKSQCEYISIKSGNVIEIPENEKSFFVKMYNEISEFFEYLRG